MRFPAPTLLLALAGAAIAVPLSASADAPAAAVPRMPAPFIGAPTNDNPDNGQFTLNFDEQGRYLGIGTAPEHLSNFNLTQEHGRAQTRVDARTAAKQAAAGNSVFASFRVLLRDVAAPQAADFQTTRR